MRSPAIHKALTALLAACLAGRALGAAQPLGRWGALSVPSSGYSRYLYDMAMEPDGTLWVMASKQLYRWDGKEFVAPATAKLTCGYALAALYGGGDRPVYASQLGDKDHSGKLYRLEGGEARYVADFRYDTTKERPGLYVARSGTLVNWGREFLAVHAGGEWRRVDASLHPRYAVVLDTGKQVHLYYNDKLYTADAAGRVTARDLPAAGPAVAASGQSLAAAVWGSNTMLSLRCGGQGLRLYDLATLESLFPLGLRGAFERATVHDCFRAADGAVWVLAEEPAQAGYAFHRVSTDGRVRRVEATAGLDWDSGRTSLYRHAVLHGSDGSLWLGLPRRGVARYKGGALRVFGWKDGLADGGSRLLLQGPDGRVYAAGRTAVYVFHPDKPPAPPPADVGLWEEFELASCRPLRDSLGRVWMFLKDRPGHLSRWDGARWLHVPVPFDTSKVSRALADDRGRLLLIAPEACFIVGPAGVERHENVKAMLEWAIVDGARRFDVGPGLAGCVVTDEGHIWFGRAGQRYASHFDGAAWHRVYVYQTLSALFESPSHGVLLHDSYGRYWTYREGGLGSVYAKATTGSRWLLGPKGRQPFEEQLLAQRPGVYVPLVRRSDRAYSVLAPARDGRGSLAAGGVLRSTVGGVTRAVHGGHWTSQRTASGVTRRVFGGRVVVCQVASTPLAGWAYGVQEVLEDRAHGLWFYVGSGNGARRVFCKRLSGFRLKLGAVAAQATRSVELTAEPVLPGLSAEALRLFWRFRDGPWRGGLAGNSVTVRFPADGDYTIELLGMDRQGGTTPETERVAIRARVPLPDTQLTDKGPYRGRDVVWRVPVRLVPSAAGATPTLVYRVDGGAWRVARSRRFVYLAGVRPGEHVVELAAREEGYYRDPSPLRLPFVYAPDYEQIVAERLERLASSNNAVAVRAEADIRLAGPGVVPALKRKLAQAAGQPALAARIKALLKRLSPKTAQR